MLNQDGGYIDRHFLFQPFTYLIFFLKKKKNSKNTG